MRPEILTSIPNVLDPSKEVLVFGGDSFPHQKGLSQLIGELNQEKTWIRSYFGDMRTPIINSARVGVVITMMRTSPVVATTIREAVKASGGSIISPPPGLTVSEVKGVLKALAERREQRNSAKSDAPTSADVLPEESIPLKAVIAHGVTSNESDEPPPTKETDTPGEEIKDPDMALALSNVEAFASMADDVKIALLILSDKISRFNTEQALLAQRAQTAELELLRVKDNAKTTEYALRTMTTERDILGARVRELEAKLSQFHNAISAMSKIGQV